MPRWWNGRHGSLRGYYPKGCAGSSPALGTKAPVVELVYTVASKATIYMMCGFDSHLVYKNMRVWGNGRPAGFRSQCPKGRVGSSPTTRTKFTLIYEVIKKLKI
jgi:hypothetical protein